MQKSRLEFDVRILSRRSAALAVQIPGWPVLGLMAAARLGTFRRPWPLELIDICLPYLLALWPAFGLLAAHARSRGLGLFTVVGSLYGLIAFATACGRGRRPVLAVGPRLRVLTANVRSENPSADGLVALIERERPDLVALQELRPAFAVALIPRVGCELPHSDVQPDEGYAGAALLSRWPLEHVERFRLAQGRHLCQRASLRVNDEHVYVFNIHLEIPFEVYTRPGRYPPVGIRRHVCSARDRQVDELVSLLAQVREAAIVVGDFNTAAGTRAHRLLLGQLRDAFQEVGRGFGHTFPEPGSREGLNLPFPLLRIDYGFFRGSLEPLSAWIASVPGSDHRALFIDFALSGRAARPVGSGAGAKS